MASYTVTAAKHATLTANTVDTVTVTVDVLTITVTNRDGSAEIYFTVDGTTPSVGGDDTLMLPASMCERTVPVENNTSVATVIVNLVSDGSPAYTVSTVA